MLWRNPSTARVKLAISALTLASSLCALARAQEPTPLTVERIYSAPSLAGAQLDALAWRPDGRKLIYLRTDETSPGPRTELWIVDAESGKQQVLIAAGPLAKLLHPAISRGVQTGLGRVEPAAYFWAPDGSALLFASASELDWYDLATQSSRTIVRALPAKSGQDWSDLDDPKISPDGKWVSFLRDHDVWIASVATGAARPLTRGGSEELRNGELDWVYPEELDLHTAYWWSPDSSAIAFLQLDERPVNRYPLVDQTDPRGTAVYERYPAAGDPNPIAKAGVVAISGGAPRWLDTGADSSVLLARVQWLPDSKRVAIERLNRAQTRLDLLFADAATGNADTILTEQDTYWLNLSDILFFFSDNHRFLWSSERTGFRHLYLYDVTGKMLKQLTHGDWEVETVDGVDEGGQFVYFTSTQKSPIERQLYRVSLQGEDPEPLTTLPGTHAVLFAPRSASHFVDTYSDANTPPRQALVHADGTPEITLNENHVPELAAYHLSPVEFFTLPGADGTPLYASLIKPPNFDPAKKYPVLIHYYGGPGVQEVLNGWDEGVQWQFKLWHELMAQKGFVVLTLDNRGQSGRGHAFETPIWHKFGSVEMADQLAGVAWLKQQPWADTSRMGIWGGSFGGYMTCYLMLNAPGVYRAGVALAPVTDWHLYDTIYTERYMGTPQDDPDGYNAGGVLDKAAQLEGKLLIAHGTADDNVHFGQTVALADKFVSAGKNVEYQIYGGLGHHLGDTAARIQLFNLMTQFFLDNVRGQ
jgi:dipeptidyl-peptidase-4